MIQMSRLEGDSLIVNARVLKILGWFHEHPGTTVSDIGDALGNMTRTYEYTIAMIAHNLLQYSPGPRKNNRKYITLTEKGDRIYRLLSEASDILRGEET